MFKIRLDIDDKRKCAWVLFKRCKRIFYLDKKCHNSVFYDMIDADDEKDILRNI